MAGKYSSSDKVVLLKGGSYTESAGGPPHDGDMEARLAKLETDVGEIKSVLERSDD